MKAITPEQFEDWREGQVTQAFMKAYSQMLELTTKEIENMSRKVALSQEAMFARNTNLAILQEKEDNFRNVLDTDWETINEILGIEMEKK